MKDLKPGRVKAPLDLLPAAPLRAISAAMEEGAIKYDPWNWQDRSGGVREYYAALLRHVLSANDPSLPDYTDDSKLHHLAHAGACVLILLWKMDIDYQKPVVNGDIEGLCRQASEIVGNRERKRS